MRASAEGASEKLLGVRFWADRAPIHRPILLTPGFWLLAPLLELLELLEFSQTICERPRLMYGSADPMNVESLRSPYVKTGGLYYFARMIDKARLHAAKLLPGDYQQVLGLGFDGRTCRFLQVDYKEFTERVLQGGADEELLQWCFTRGRTPTDEEISMWNDWVRKKGWRDETSARLKQRLQESGFQDRTDIQTMFDYLDLDEGRDPRHRNWDQNGEF